MHARELRFQPDPRSRSNLVATLRLSFPAPKCKSQIFLAFRRASFREPSCSFVLPTSEPERARRNLLLAPQTRQRSRARRSLPLARRRVMQDQPKPWHHHSRPIPYRKKHQRIFRRPRPPHQDLFPHQRNIVLRCFMNHRCPQILIGIRCGQTDLRRAHRRDISQIVFQLIIMEFAGRKLPSRARKQHERAQTGNDFGFFHNRKQPGRATPSIRPCSATCPCFRWKE